MQIAKFNNSLLVMIEHQKIFRIFQLLARLRIPLGCTKEDIADDFGVAIRTVERYIALLRDIGFNVETNQGRYRIPSVNKLKMEIEDLIHFSIEEAQIVKTALENQPIKTPLQQSLMTKLYALTEMPELADTVYDQKVSQHISNLYHAIRYKEQVVLKKYQSLNSATTKDRLVEPIRLYRYNRYLAAYEIASGRVKDFKIERVAEVELTNNPAEHKDAYGEYGVDIFGMTGDQLTEVRLKLSERAATLLKEEFPETKQLIHKQNNKLVFTCKVYSWKGIGRFILGLPGEIKIESPEDLILYVKEKKCSRK
jgi:predicted DNA-binding transcriptional regulator YafY